MYELVICHSTKRPRDPGVLVALEYQSHPQCKYTWGEWLMLVIGSISISWSSRGQRRFPYLCLEFLKENVRMLQEKRGNTFGFGFLWWWWILVSRVWRSWFRIWVHFSWCSAQKLGGKKCIIHWPECLQGSEHTLKMQGKEKKKSFGV